MTIAIYARVSSESQEARGTIGSQLEALRRKMAELGHDAVHEFRDDGYSGARLDRPGLDALRDAAEAGRFKQVWCLTPDRLARSYAYQILITDELARHGVQVHYLDAPPLDDDPEATAEDGSSVLGRVKLCIVWFRMATAASPEVQPVPATWRSMSQRRRWCVASLTISWQAASPCDASADACTRMASPVPLAT